jgi:VanZ family protein
MPSEVDREKKESFMQRIEPATRWVKIVVVACTLLVLAFTLSAGLWPFSFQMDNQISWKTSPKGLYFGDYAMVISGGTFKGIPGIRGKGYSIEIWMEPGLTRDSNEILTFYQPNGTERIVVGQSGDDLIFARYPADTKGHMKPRVTYVDRTFRKGDQILITLTSNEGQTDIYLNGALKRTAKNLVFTGNDFTGTLVLCNSPFANNSWMGTFQGLAFYDRALESVEVRKHYLAWQADRTQLAVQADPPYSLYLFNEKEGEILHNLGKGGPDLVIPKHYFIFCQGFLTPFWKEYRPNLDYAKDIAINVFGLVPLGFCFAALIAWLLGRKRSLLYTAILGFCVSLTIELLQAFMPTRISGTTDLITNTTGTALGGWLYLNGLTQGLAKRLGLIRTD